MWGHDGVGAPYQCVVCLLWAPVVFDTTCSPVKETARLLLDGMPTKGLRVLNIGFGIGMVTWALRGVRSLKEKIFQLHSYRPQ